jgi:hypothetical protein
MSSRTEYFNHSADMKKLVDAVISPNKPKFRENNKKMIMKQLDKR